MKKEDIEKQIDDLKAEKVELTEVFMQKLGEALALFHLISSKEDDGISCSRKRQPAPWNPMQAAKYFSALEQGIDGRPRIDVQISKLKKDLLRLKGVK